MSPGIKVPGFFIGVFGLPERKNTLSNKDFNRKFDATNIYIH